MSLSGNITAYHYDPFTLGSPKTYVWHAGMTLQQIVDRTPNLPENFHTAGVIYINEMPFFPEVWHLVRPHGSTPEKPVVLSMHVRMQGGDGFKQVVALVAVIALSIATGGIASAGIPSLGIAGGSWTAAAVAAGLQIGGALLIAAFIAPPTRSSADKSSSTDVAVEAASVSGNVLAANAPIPRVIGTRRVFPPMVMEPYIERVGQNEYVYALYGLAGAHRVESPRLADTAIGLRGESLTDAELEIREGLPTELRPTRIWAFHESMEGWSLSTGSPTFVDNGVEFQGPNALATSGASLDLQGYSNPVIFLDIECIEGTSTSTNYLRYATSGHGFSSAYQQALPPLNAGERRVFYLDMSDLAAGGTDWTDSWITQLQLQIDAANKYIVREIRAGIMESMFHKALDFNTRQARSLNYNFEMSRHQTTEDAPQTLISTDAVPVWHGVSSRDTPNEVWIHFDLLGLVRNDAPTQDLRIPFRIRMRKRGTREWRYLPEIHYMGNAQATKRLQFKLNFTGAIPGQPADAPTKGFVEARKASPGQTIAPATDTFEADAYFSAGAGEDSFTNATQSTTNVRNVTLGDDSVTFHLDYTAGWDTGTYDIELIRGMCVADNTYNPTTYQVSGSVWDLFGYRNSRALPLTRAGLLDTVRLLRAISVWYSSPVKLNNLTLVSLRAMNRSIEGLSILASGYTNDWDGTGWNTQVFGGRYIAAHFVDILSGTLNYSALPDYMRDDASILAWRDDIFANGWQCNLVAENRTVEDVLKMVASCGYAQPWYSEKWGVVRDYDRTGEVPVQIFSSSNARGFMWRKAFANLPSGLRVNYQDGVDADTQTQVIVYAPTSESSVPRLDQITYEGLIWEDAVIERARYDLAQLKYRSTFYSFTTPIDWIRCRRGSLIGINYDVVDSWHVSGWINELIVADGYITGIILREAINIVRRPDMSAITDMTTVDALDLAGTSLGVTIRQTDGDIITAQIANADGNYTNTLYFETPIPIELWAGSPYDEAAIPKIDRDCLVTVGTLHKHYRRCVVTEIIPQDAFTANITCIDEAPEIWKAMEA